MGQGLRFTRTPEGQVMTTPVYNDYMANIYNPQQDFNAAGSAPIPGLTAPGVAMPNPAQGMPPAGLLPVGRAPPPSFVGGSAPMSPAPPNPGPYGQQAMLMAGLLGPQQSQPQGGLQGGLLGGPKRGFRVPGGK